MRWGILGTGQIARTFVRDLKLLDDQKVISIGSRNKRSAQSFASNYHIPNFYGSYEELVNDPNIDGVYIATPHPYHCSNSLLALNAHKPVLCEKPFAISSQESEVMVAKAQENKLLLMEAMWMRFLPHILHIKKIISNGEIGEITSLEADFSIKAKYDVTSRLFSPELGGGALLDLGIYPISLSFMILGKPKFVSAQAVMAPSGVDISTNIIFNYESGAESKLRTSLQSVSSCGAIIEGSRGRIEIQNNFFAPTSFKVIQYKNFLFKVKRYQNNYEGHGIREQAIEFARVLYSKKTESDLLPHIESIAIMTVIDEIRSQIGLKFPFES